MSIDCQTKVMNEDTLPLLYRKNASTEACELIPSDTTVPG